MRDMRPGKEVKCTREDKGVHSQLLSPSLLEILNEARGPVLLKLLFSTEVPMNLSY